MATTALAASVMRNAPPTPNRAISAPCRATIGHTDSAKTMKNKGYAWGPALFRKIDWAALKAVYRAQPRTMAKPASWRVRTSSVRWWWRNFARNGKTSGPRFTLRLLDAGDLLQRGDPFLDRRMCVEEPAEEAAVMLLGVVDHHRGDRVVEPLGRLVALGDLLQRRYEAGRVARELDAADVGERLALPRQRQLHQRTDHERDEREEDAD